MDRQEWLKERQTGIGGSDAAAIVMGVDSFGRTAADVYDSKVLPVEDKEPTPVMRRGVVLEPIAADEYVAHTGRQIRRQPMRRHRRYPFMIGNVDRQQVGGEWGPGVLEIKCPGLSQFSKLMYHGLDSSKIFQMMHYINVFDYQWGTFAIFNAEYMKTVWFDVCRTQEQADAMGGDTPVYVIDPVLMQRMVDAEIEFWGMVERRERPVPIMSDVVVPESEGTIVVREDPEWAEVVAQMWEGKDLIATAQSVHDDAVERVKELCGEHGSYEGAGCRVHWKPTKGRSTFDKGALAASRPLDRNKVYEWIATGKELPDDLDLDLDKFYKTGAPGEKFSAYRLKHSTDDE